MTTAAMVGAGLIGRSWAMVFARAGWQRAAVRQCRGAARRGARAHRKRACRAAGVRARRRCRGGVRTHRVRRRSRAGARRRRLGAGERARSARREARAVSAHRSRDAGDGNRRELDVGDSRVAIHRGRLPDARAASSRIRSIRRISCPWSSCAARRGPTPRRSSARAR